MPKEVLKIEDFSGGINSYSDPRDIEDNQLVVADNVDVTKLGVLQSGISVDSSYEFTDSSTSHNISLASPAGTGLFAFSHDYESPGDIGWDILGDSGLSDASYWVSSGTYLTLAGGKLVFDPTGTVTRTVTQPRAKFTSSGHTLKNSGPGLFIYRVEPSTLVGTNLESVKILDTGIAASNYTVSISSTGGYLYKAFTFSSDCESTGDFILEFKSNGSNCYVQMDAFYCIPYLRANRTNFFAQFDRTGNGQFDIYMPNGGRKNWNDTGRNPLNWNNSGGDATTFHANTTDSSAIPSYNYFEGVLRLSDANFSNTNVPLWRGFIDRPLIGTSAYNYRGQLRGFWTYEAIIKKPEYEDSSVIFSNGGTPTMTNTSGTDQIGLAIDFTEVVADEMIAGFQPNSPSNGITSDTEYDVSGNYGATCTVGGLGTGDAEGNNDNGYDIGDTAATMGENVADSTNAHHNEEDGYYIYPKDITGLGAANGGTPSIIPFAMGNGSFKINWGAGDKIAFEIRGFNQQSSSWANSMNVDSNGNFYVTAVVTADSQTDTAFHREWERDNDTAAANQFGIGRKVDAGASNAGWQTVEIGTDYGLDGDRSDAYIYDTFPYNDNQDWDDFNNMTNHKGWMSSVFGYGRGFKIVLSSPANPRYSTSQGLKTHDATAGAGSGAHIGFRNFRIIRGANSVASANSIGTYTFFYSFLYDEEKIESGLSRFSDEKVTISKGSDFKFKVYVRRDEVTCNRRITGARIYFQKEGDSAKYLMCDVDMREGTKKPGDVGYTDWTMTNLVNEYKANSDFISFGGDEMEEFTQAFISYKANVGTAGEFINYRWKTSTIINRRMYIGNVAKIDESGNVLETFGDRVVKSLPNQFDRFHEDSWVEVVSADGDDIIHLENYAERILQFKRKTLFIINVSGGNEFLEGQYKHLGIDNSCQVCATEIGVFWTNDKGLHLYDGQKIHDLTEGRVPPGDFTPNSETNIPSVGYSPINKKLIICNRTIAGSSGTDRADGWVFCLKTFSLTKLKGMFPNTSGGVLTNFINDVNGDLLYSMGNNWYKIVDTPSNMIGGVQSKEFELQTKDYTFGDSAVLKKIHKVYVTYKMPSNNSKILIKGAINGSADFTDVSFSNVQNYDGTNGFLTSTGWATAIIKPSSSLSCYSLQFKIYASTPGTSNIQSFQINDLSVVYRRKTVK